MPRPTALARKPRWGRWPATKNFRVSSAWAPAPGPLAAVCLSKTMIAARCGRRRHAFDDGIRAAGSTVPLRKIRTCAARALRLERFRPRSSRSTLERGYAAARAQIITVLGLPKVRIIECLRLVVRTVAQQKDRNPPRMRDVASILLRGNHDRSPWANASGATAEANRSPYTLAVYGHRYIRDFALL